MKHLIGIITITMQGATCAFMQAYDNLNADAVISETYINKNNTQLLRHMEIYLYAFVITNLFALQRGTY